MAATGGTPAQARRVVLAGGARARRRVGAVLGVVLGIGVGWALLPIVQRYSGELARPVRRAVAAPRRHRRRSDCSARSSPPSSRRWIASRQDVVAVLAGRRGDRAPVAALAAPRAAAAGRRHRRLRTARGATGTASSRSRSRPILGRARHDPAGPGRGRRSSPGSRRRLPLSLRYAVRDAARHRTRTVPAVAAVAATVAGVVALGIANSQRRRAEPRRPTSRSCPPVTAWSRRTTRTTPCSTRRWPRSSSARSRTRPSTPVRGIVEGRPTGTRPTRVPRARRAGPTACSTSTPFPTGQLVLVSDGDWPSVLGVRRGGRRTASAGPRSRRATCVVFSSRPIDQREVRSPGGATTARATTAPDPLR